MKADLEHEMKRRVEAEQRSQLIRDNMSKEEIPQHLRIVEEMSAEQQEMVKLRLKEAF